MPKPKKIDIEYITNRYDYHPDGYLLWKCKACGTKGIGTKVYEQFKNGYSFIIVNRGRFSTHRIIYALIHGTEPDIIDHIDGNPLNNKIENLRECSSQVNVSKRKQNKDNKSGYRGVHWNRDKCKWRAAIRYKSKVKNLGDFSNITDAARAYNKAAQYFNETFGSEYPLHDV